MNEIRVEIPEDLESHGEIIDAIIDAGGVDGEFVKAEIVSSRVDGVHGEITEMHVTLQGEDDYLLIAEI